MQKYINNFRIKQIRPISSRAYQQSQVQLEEREKNTNQLVSQKPGVELQKEHLQGSQIPQKKKELQVLKDKFEQSLEAQNQEVKEISEIKNANLNSNPILCNSEQQVQKDQISSPSGKSSGAQKQEVTEISETKNINLNSNSTQCNSEQQIQKDQICPPSLQSLEAQNQEVKELSETKDDSLNSNPTLCNSEQRIQKDQISSPSGKSSGAQNQEIKELSEIKDVSLNSNPNLCNSEQKVQKDQICPSSNQSLETQNQEVKEFFETKNTSLNNMLTLSKSDTPFEDKKPQIKQNSEDYSSVLSQKDKEIEKLNQIMNDNKENTNHEIEKLKEKMLKYEQQHNHKENQYLKEIEKLEGMKSDKVKEIQALKEINSILQKKSDEDQQQKERDEKEKLQKQKDEENLKLNIEARIKKSEAFSEEYLISLKKFNQQNQPQAKQIYQQPQQQFQQQINLQEQLKSQNNQQRYQQLQQQQNQYQNEIVQQQQIQQQYEQMSGQQNYKMNNNIQSDCSQNADFYSQLIQAKYLNNNIPFFQNPVIVEDILVQEYSGNEQIRNELDQLFQSENIQWISIVRGDGNCFFRSFFIEYLLIKMIDFTSAANFSQEIQQFLRTTSQIPIRIPAGIDKFFGDQVNINALVQFTLDYFYKIIAQFTQQSAVRSLMESLNDPVFDLAMQILSKSMIIKAVQEIKQNQIQNLYEYIDAEKISQSVLDFNAENGSSEIYACLATYLEAYFLLLSCQKGTKNEFQTYEPLPGIPESPLKFKRNDRNGFKHSGCSQLALWLNTGHYYILYTKDLADRLTSIHQNSRD